MRINKRKMIRDILILIVPMVIILLLTPFPPDKISIHRGLNNRYIGKHFTFLLGAIPFPAYKPKFEKK